MLFDGTPLLSANLMSPIFTDVIVPDRSRLSRSQTRPGVVRSSSGQGKDSDNSLPPEATPAPVSENGSQPADTSQQSEEQPALFDGWREVSINRAPLFRLQA